MSEAKRAYDLLRGYVNREWDRVRGLELMDAWRELDAPSVKSTESSGDTSAKNEIYDDPTKVEDGNYEATARTILGVHADADFKAIRHAYEKLSRRSQPENFQDGSQEAERAQNLLRRATWAYQYLTKNVSSSEKRFKSLEIE